VLGHIDNPRRTEKRHHRLRTDPNPCRDAEAYPAQARDAQTLRVSHVPTSGTPHPPKHPGDAGEGGRGCEMG